MEPRPGRSDPQVLDAFYDAMSKALHADSDMATGMSLEQIEQGLRYAGTPALDGYAYAKQLESNGWSGISAQDIETLDGAHGFLHQAIRNAEIAWIGRNKILPPITSGSRVKAKIARILPGAKRVEECVADGHAYLDDKNSAAGYCVFRDAQWVETRGEEGGYVIPWESLQMKPGYYR